MFLERPLHRDGTQFNVIGCARRLVWAVVIGHSFELLVSLGMWTWIAPQTRHPVFG